MRVIPHGFVLQTSRVETSVVRCAQTKLVNLMTSGDLEQGFVAVAIRAGHGNQIEHRLVQRDAAQRCVDLARRAVDEANAIVASAEVKVVAPRR